MRQIGCYKGLAGPDTANATAPLGGRARAARAVMGVGIVASVGVLYLWPVALLTDLGMPTTVAWGLAIPSLWLGASHLVAAVTAYRGCPEIGAIPSLILRRRVETSCRPWERIDQRIEPAA